MKTVRFVQFVRPFGSKRYVSINLEDEVADKADEIWNKGFKLTVEELMTGQVSMAIEGHNKDHAIKVCENGPDVAVNATEMITEFDLENENPDDEV